MAQHMIQINSQDNVLVALQEIKRGETILLTNLQVTALEDIPKGHKMAVQVIPAGTDVIKFGHSIGNAKETIHPGEWVHTHNLQSGLKGILEYHYQPAAVESHETYETHENHDSRTFPGYLRDGGKVGIRNEIWILNTVGCINKTCEMLAKLAGQQYKDRKVDGIHHFSHPYGCSQLGDDLLNTQKILAGLVDHPNAGGVLVVGLGCENNNIREFKKVLGDYDPRRVKFLSVQEENDELEEGLKLLEELVGYAETFVRQPVLLSKLIVGLKCGGSDGFSGITANPLVGAFSDMLIGYGGTTILTEVPEMFGAETILMNRAENDVVFEKTVHLINDFKAYFLRHDQVVYENPSPGNKEGGITTLEEKSLGCTQKGGTTRVVDVLSYGHRVSKNGLNLLEAPGNDLVSVTALIAAGAQLVLFTTGRGTPFGGPVPTVKISTTTGLSEKKRTWIDFNAGQLLDGRSMDDVKADFFEYITAVASGGMQTRNEQNGFKEIAIFKSGVTL